MLTSETGGPAIFADGRRPDGDRRAGAVHDPPDGATSPHKELAALRRIKANGFRETKVTIL